MGLLSRCERKKKRLSEGQSSEHGTHRGADSALSSPHKHFVPLRFWRMPPSGAERRKRKREKEELQELFNIGLDQPAEAGDTASTKGLSGTATPFVVETEEVLADDQQAPAGETAPVDNLCGTATPVVSDTEGASTGSGTSAVAPRPKRVSARLLAQQEIIRARETRLKDGDSLGRGRAGPAGNGFSGDGR